jgi:hypothetical protein
MGYFSLFTFGHGAKMNIDQVKEFVTNQLKSYKVTSIIKEWSDTEFLTMYEQLTSVKPHEVERRLIDWARHELDFFRYVLYKERHYEDLLIDHACIDCLKCEDLTLKERKYYVRKPIQSKANIES